MGGSSSKVTQLTEIVQKTVSNVLISISSRGQAVYDGTQDVTIINNTGEVSNLTMEQVALINLEVIQDASVNAEMQQKMVNELMNQVKQKQSDFPQITKTKTDTEIRNIIHNEVEANFRLESLAALQMNLTQKQNLLISGNSGNVTQIMLSQKVDAIGKLVNTMSTNLATKLTSDTTSNSSTDQTKTFFGSDLLDSAFNGLNGLISSPIIILLVFVGLIFLAVFASLKYTSSSDATHYQEPYQAPIN